MHRWTFIMLLVMPACTAALAQDQNNINDIISSYDYSVPNSPAFALLPDKPNQVLHIASVKDIQSNLLTIFNDGFVRQQFAFDLRPFVFFPLSLDDYRGKPLRRILWRTVVSVGLTQDPNQEADVLGAIGIRIPLIDQSDPRRDSVYINGFNNLVRTSIAPIVLSVDSPEEADSIDTQALEKVLVDAPSLEKLEKELEDLKEDRASVVWNAFKWDLGASVMGRAQSGKYTSRDSVLHEKLGAWTAVAFPMYPFFKKSGQIDASLSILGTNRTKNDQEKIRIIAGTRARIFFNVKLPFRKKKSSFALSGEVARVWSRYGDRADLNETWTHLGGALEFKLFGGWLGLAYGGDTANRENPDRQFGLHYAIYSEQLLKK